MHLWIGDTWKRTNIYLPNREIKTNKTYTCKNESKAKEQCENMTCSRCSESCQIYQSFPGAWHVVSMIPSSQEFLWVPESILPQVSIDTSQFLLREMKKGMISLSWTPTLLLKISWSEVSLFCSSLHLSLCHHPLFLHVQPTPSSLFSPSLLLHVSSSMYTCI